MCSSDLCRGFTTSRRPSHVIKFWMNAANSCHGWCKEAGLIHLFFHSNGSSRSLYTATASLRRRCLSAHLSPCAGIPETSAIISFVTSIVQPLTLVFPSCRFFRNPIAILVLDPCSLCTYVSHPARWRMALAPFEIGNFAGSLRRVFLPINDILFSSGYFSSWLCCFDWMLSASGKEIVALCR